MNKAAMGQFIKLQEDLGLQKLVIASQNRLIFDLVRRLGGEVRMKMSDDLDDGWELVTAHDEPNNELVLTARRSTTPTPPITPIDINNGEANSPKI